MISSVCPLRMPTSSAVSSFAVTTMTGISDERGPLAQLAQKLEAVHLRHHQVEQDQAWGRMGGKPVQAAAAINRRIGRISHAYQCPAERLAGRQVIFDDEDRGAPRTCCNGRAGSLPGVAGPPAWSRNR